MTDTVHTTSEPVAFTHVVKDSETGIILDYCTSEAEARQFATEENKVAFEGEARAVVELLSDVTP